MAANLTSSFICGFPKESRFLVIIQHHKALLLKKNIPEMGQIKRRGKKKTTATDISRTRVECSCTSIERFVFAVVLCNKYGPDMEDRDAVLDCQQHQKCNMMMMITQDSGTAFDSRLCFLAPGVNLGVREQVQKCNICASEPQNGNSIL